jgi:hypothetical protein
MTTGQTDEPYHGNCHCGRFRFKLTVNDIKEAIVCPCSLCAKRGCLWIIPGPGTFAVTRDEGCLTEYVSTAMKSKVSLTMSSTPFQMTAMASGIVFS